MAFHTQDVLGVHGVGVVGSPDRELHLGRVDHELCPQRGERANDTPVDLPQCRSAPISLFYGHSNTSGGRS